MSKRLNKLIDQKEQKRTSKIIEEQYTPTSRSQVASQMDEESKQSEMEENGPINYEMEDEEESESQLNEYGSEASVKDPETIKLKPRRSIEEQTHDLRILLNKIFALRGGWRVESLARDFSDGFLFQELFNILYDERINCCLEGDKDKPNPKLPLETRVSNWNKINAGICFNYF